MCLWEGLENELEDIRDEIKEKTLLLDSSDTRIANLCKGPVPLLSGKKTRFKIQDFFYCHFVRHQKCKAETNLRARLHLKKMDTT